MFYPDLEPVRSGFSIYPKVLNIGWLDNGYTYYKGLMNTSLVTKLKEIILLDLDQMPDDEFCGIQHHPKNIIVHRMHMMGEPFRCPFCKSKVSLHDDSGREMILGKNEVIIPSVNRDYVFCFPTLVYHYVTKHNYLPSEVFLKALAYFSLDKPYNYLEDPSIFDVKKLVSM